VNKRSDWIWMIFLPVLLLSGCGQSQSQSDSQSHSQSRPPAHADPLPRGVMSPAQACRQILGKPGRGFFTGPEQVHLVLTTYVKGEPVESQGDISSGMPPQTLVWVVEVHAKAINWVHSVPAGYKASAQPDTDFSVVMNARTGFVADQGECTCWPLPLSKIGTVISLPPKC
jgi:hypothetical protein